MKRLLLYRAGLLACLVATSSLSASPTTDPVHARETAGTTADELITAIKSVKFETFDPARQNDPAYVQAFTRRRNDATLEQMNRRLAFIRAYPTHKYAGSSAAQALRAAASLGRPTGILLDEMLALPLAADAKITLRTIRIESLIDAPGQDLDEAAKLIATFKHDYPQDQRTAMLEFEFARKVFTQGGTATLLRGVIRDYAGSTVATVASGMIRQADAAGKPFELAFDDLTTGKHIDVRKDFHGKVVVIDFWATWCGPCVAQLPQVIALAERYRTKGVEFVGVSLDRDEDNGRTKLADMVAKMHIPFPQFYEGKAWDAPFSSSWGITMVPAAFVIDADGNFVCSTDANAIVTWLDKLIAQRDAAPATRPALP